MNNASVVQAARGPILLITLGVLMAVSYATPFTFDHTWPVLIIIFGLLKLLERMAGTSPYGGPGTRGFQPPPPPPQNPGSMPPGGFPPGGFQQ